ncbi:MAG: MFS transporter [Armatimonadota bacterium]|nr:MFS transporter [Armatimonadota bacterium]MDR7491154.1 MFS transporter [Armatimonadota bacterium]MDR7528336.1 MFS transporter [Armatimonadota bacterium]MDR7543729.1 MFS transporter [Armatimonadota bacterium]MDR7573775.1 MFS transporter [Armatimonadota bacterium]
MPAAGLPRLPRAFAALGHNGFRIFWASMFFSTAGLQMDVVLRAWLAFHLTGSGLALGTVVLARGLPQLVLPLLTGVAVNRADKRTLLLLAQFAFGGLALLTAVLVNAGWIAVWHLVVIGLLQGAVLSFNAPLRHAYVGGLLKGEALANATALNLTLINLNTVLAPLLAGIFLDRSPALAFAVVTALFAIAGLRLTALPPAPPAPSRGPVIVEMREGLQYVARHPGLRGLLALLFLGVALGLPFQQFLPVFQARVLHVGDAALGVLYATFGLGSLGGSLLVAQLAGHPRRGEVQLATGILLGVGLMAFAVTRHYLTALLLLVLLGVAGQAFTTMNSVLMMLITPQELQSRVMSLS